MVDTNHLGYDAFVDQFYQTAAKDLVDCLPGRKINVLHNVCPIDKRGVYKTRTLWVLCKRESNVRIHTNCCGEIAC